MKTHHIDDVIKKWGEYKGQKFFYILEPFGHINFFKNNYEGVSYGLFEKIKKILKVKKEEIEKDLDKFQKNLKKEL